MKRHVVRPGECTHSLAAASGASADDIWDHPDNRELRERRRDPALLREGDEIALPEPRPASHAVDPGGSHAFTAPVTPVRLRLELRDEVWDSDTKQGQKQDEGSTTTYRAVEAVEPPRTVALANIAYRLEAGGRTIEGTTDGAGVLDEAIDARLTVARLVLEPGTEHERRLEVRVGYLDPADEPSGLVQRLTNLGFPCKSDEEPAIMIATYQKSRGLTISGELDDATKQKIVDESGG